MRVLCSDVAISTVVVAAARGHRRDDDALLKLIVQRRAPAIGHPDAGLRALDLSAHDLLGHARVVIVQRGSQREMLRAHLLSAVPNVKAEMKDTGQLVQRARDQVNQALVAGCGGNQNVKGCIDGQKLGVAPAIVVNVGSRPCGRPLRWLPTRAMAAAARLRTRRSAEVVDLVDVGEVTGLTM